MICNVNSEYFIQAVENYVKDLLENELHRHLKYHTLEHTKEVVAAVREIAVEEKVNNEELEILLIAAWLHDIGYTKIYAGHEKESIKMSLEFLRKINYPESKIEKVIECIEATQFRFKAKNKLQEIIIDADRLAMGTEKFLEKGELLRAEWELALKNYYTDAEWFELQLQYLEQTRFLTDYCNRIYAPERLVNILKTKVLKEEAEEQENKTNPALEFLEKNRYTDFKFIGYLILLGLIISTIISVSIWSFTKQSMIVGTISGILMGIVMFYSEKSFERNIERKITFPLALASRTILLNIIFFISLALSTLIYAELISPIPAAEIFKNKVMVVFENPGNIFQFFILTFLISFIINYIKVTSRIIGPRILFNYVKGMYKKPIAENRIFMFLDINSSTRLAEQLGSINYHLLLNEFFNDISVAIHKTEGEVYQYVGDEIVITWRMEEGLRKSNCVRCYFEIDKTLKTNRKKYQDKYGVLLGFKVGLHGGKVITAEIGQIKSDIVYHGDVLNTTERILSQCNPLNKKILISEPIVRQLNLFPGYEYVFVTDILLRGKGKSLKLYTVK